MLQKPEPGLAGRAELEEALEDVADGVGDRLIGVQEYLSVVLPPDQADRQAPPQLAPLGLVPDAAVQARSQDMQLGLLC